LAPQAQLERRFAIMAPQLKQFWLGTVSIFFGLILFIGSLIFDAYIHPDYLFFIPIALSGGDRTYYFWFFMYQL